MTDTAQTRPGAMFERAALEALALGTARVLRGSWTVISAVVAGLLAVAILTMCQGRVRAADEKTEISSTTSSSRAPQLP